MVAVQYLLGTLQIQVVLGIFAPRQIDQRLQVGQLHVEVGRVGIHLIQLLQLFVEELLYLFRPLLLGSLLHQFLLLGRALVAHLCLQVLDLLLQEVVALLLVDVIARLVADVELQVLQVNLTVHDAHRAEQTLLDAVKLEQSHLLLDAERHVRTDEVQGHDVVSHVLDGKRGFLGDVITHVDILCRLVAQVFDGRAELHVSLVGLLLGGLHRMSYHVGLVFQNLLQTQTTQTLHDGSDVTVGQRQYLQYLGQHAVVVEVGADRTLHLWVTLTDHAYHAVLLLSFADERHARLATNQNGGYYTRKQYQIAHSQNGQCLGHFHIHQVAVIALYIGNHLERPILVIHVHCYFLFHNRVQSYNFFLK